MDSSEEGKSDDHHSSSAPCSRSFFSKFISLKCTMENSLKRVLSSLTCDRTDGCSVSKRPLLEDENLNAFIEWCHKANFKFNPKVKICEEGSIAKYGLIATEDITRGECLFEIPRSHVLVAESSSIAELTETVDLKSTKSDKGWITLLLCIMYEYNNPKSKWRSYFNLVPDFKHLELPLFWSEASRAVLLQGTCIKELVESDLNLINSDFNNVILPFVKKHSKVFSPVCQTLKFYHKMVAFVMAYSFMEPTNPVLDSSHEEQVNAPPMMVPLADILNHVANHNAELSYEVSCLKMTAVKNIKKGEEVYNTYGMLSNSQLLHMYGFAEPYPNNGNDTVEIPIKLFKECTAELGVHTGNTKLLQEKWQSLSTSNFINEDDAFLLGMHGFLTKEELVLCLQMSILDSSEFAEFKKRGGFDVVQSSVSTETKIEANDNTDDDNTADEGGDEDDGDDDDYELHFKELRNFSLPCRKLLVQVADRCLTQYRTTLEEDAIKLSPENLEQLPAYEKFALYTTHSQKKILEKLIKYCQC